MPIYENNNALNEKVTYMKNVSTYTSGVNSYASGNMFESLATTNPEGFNTAKLESILNSKNMAEEFHKYFSAIIAKDMDRYIEFLKEYADKPDNEYLYTIYRDFNISRYGVIQADLEYLRKYVSSDELIMTLFSTYLPDSLTEEGIKKLLRVRLANNQILVNGLMAMMESNYELFNISSCEAQGLINELSDKNRSDDAIGYIRNMFKNPEVLNKFKDKQGNYDFRSAGGAYLIMRDKLEWKGAAPAKYLQVLFKYDCIVYSHGNVYENERSGPIASSLTPKSSIIHQIVYLLTRMFEDDELMNILPDKIKKDLKAAKVEVTDMSKRLFINMNDLDHVYDMLKKIWSDMIDHAHTLDDADYLYSWIRAVDNFLQPISDKHNKMRNFKDGRSGRWTIRPVNTLTEKNISHVIDLLRILKREGFKNILIMSCNPGSVKLPSDIKRDPNFNVTMGLNSVLIENYTDDGMDYLNEGLLDNIVATAKNITKAMAKLFDKCKNRFNDICKDISNTVDSKLRGKKFKVKLSTIKIDNSNRPVYSEVYCNTPDELKRTINTANQSIMDMIQDISDEEKKYMDRVNQKYKIDSSIFESVKFI